MLQKIKAIQRWWNRPKSTLVDWVQTLVVFLPIVFIVRTWGYGLYQVPTGSMENTMLVGEFFFADKFSPLFKKPVRGDIISFNDPTYNYSSNPYSRLFEEYVWGPENWTKRVIGLPGDHVEGKIENGKPVVYINGELLDEPYLNQYPLILANGVDKESWRTYNPAQSYEDQSLYKMNSSVVKHWKRLLDANGFVSERTPGMPIDVAEPRMGSDVYDVHLGDNEYWAMGDNRLGSFDSRGWGKLDGNLIHGRIKFRIFSLDRQEKWLPLELLLHPIDFFKRCRWGRSLQFVS